MALRAAERRGALPRGRALAQARGVQAAARRPGWDDSEARVLSYTLAGFGDAQDLHVILNMYDQALDFELPQVPGHRWARAVDTAGAGGQEYAPPGSEPLVPEYTYHAQGRSVVVLIALPEQEVTPR